MYYTVEEISKALLRARNSIDEITKNLSEFTWGYNDCFCFLVEYDKALRDNKSKAISLKLDYNNPKEYLQALRKEGFNLRTFAEYCNYELRPDLRPQLGDIGYMDGSAVIAENGRWVTTQTDNSGTKLGTRYHFFDSRLGVLARPLRI